MHRSRYISLPYHFTLSLAACEDNNDLTDLDYQKLSEKCLEPPTIR
jgi:hypothetical protein